MSMNIRGHNPGKGRTSECIAETERIEKFERDE